MGFGRGHDKLPVSQVREVEFVGTLTKLFKR